MDTYTAVKNRIIFLCEQKRITINKLATNPGIVTLKMLCDGLGISLYDFFHTNEFEKLEQEIK